MLSKGGLELATEEDMNETGFHGVLSNALDLVRSVPPLLGTVAGLCRSLHVLIATGIDFDSSYSDPSLPYSIFVSCPPPTALHRVERLAENIVHEALHLQLSLVEAAEPLVLENQEETRLFSPWKNEPRTVQRKSCTACMCSETCGTSGISSPVAHRGIQPSPNGESRKSTANWLRFHSSRQIRPCRRWVGNWRSPCFIRGRKHGRAAARLHDLAPSGAPCRRTATRGSDETASFDPIETAPGFLPWPGCRGKDSRKEPPRAAHPACGRCRAYPARSHRYRATP